MKLTYCGTEVELPITVTGGLKGSGTAENPWLIETYQDFETVRDLVSKGLSFDGEYLKMVNDITLPEGWKPIGITKDGKHDIQNGAEPAALQRQSGRHRQDPDRARGRTSAAGLREGREGFQSEYLRQADRGLRPGKLSVRAWVLTVRSHLRSTM